MSQPYVGEIRLFAGNFAPVGWAFCNGQLESISQYEVLFNLIGTTYGGDGVNTFALPDLQSRMPVHQGTLAGGGAYVLGQSGGAEQVALVTAQLPSHTHAPRGASGADRPTAAGAVWAAANPAEYAALEPTLSLAPAAISATGGSTPHDNVPPYQAVNFIISLFGVYPTQG